MAGGNTTLLLNVSPLKESTFNASVYPVRDWASPSPEASPQPTKITSTVALEVVLLLSFILFLWHKLGKAGFTQVVSQCQGLLTDNQG